MSLFEDLEREALALRDTTNKCKICQWLLTLEDKEGVAGKIEHWYRDELPHLNLWRILRRYGLPASETSLRRHRDNCLLDGKGQSSVD